MRFSMTTLAGVLALGIASTGPAVAAVTYELEFTGATLRDSLGNDTGTFDGSFSVTTPSAITAPVTLIPTSCSISPNAAALYLCGPTHYFDPNGQSTGLNYIGFQIEHINALSRIEGFLFFDAGSFLMDGIYGLATSIPGGYGNFAPTATLTVSGVSVAAVPEPWALAILGFGLAGTGVARRKSAP